MRCLKPLASVMFETKHSQMQSIDLKFIQGPLYASRLGAGHLIHSYSDCMVQSLLYHTALALENEVFKTISDHTASVVALTKTFSGESIQCYKCILDPLVTACPFKSGGPYLSATATPLGAPQFSSFKAC